MNSKIELKEFILNSDLTDKQKNLWDNFVNSIKEEESITILEVLKEEPEVLVFLTNNIEEKINSIKNKDDKSLENIIEKEENFIKENDN